MTHVHFSQGVVRRIGIAMLLTILAACDSGTASVPETTAVDAGSATTNAGDCLALDTPIILGATLPLTSPLAGLAENVRDGYLLAIENVNSAGGVLGQELELVIKDDQFDPAQSATLTRQLINEENVIAILGTYGSAVSLTQSQEAEDNAVPHILPFASAPEVVGRGFEYLFNMYTIGPIAEGIFDDFLITTLKPERVAILYLDNPFTNASAAATIDNLAGSGIEIVAAEQFTRETEDFTAILSKIRSLEPDVLKIHGYSAQHIAIIQGMEQIGFNPPMAVYTQTQIPFEPRTMVALGASAEYVLGNPYWYPQMNVAFEQEFESRFGRVPDGHEAYQGYAAVEILVDALERACSTAADRLAAALRETDIETVAGSFTFDERGQNVSPPVIAQLIDGDVVTFYPTEQADGEWVPWVPFDER